MRLKIAVLAGDGIGPEVTQQATNILRAVAELGGHDFTFVEGLIGGTAITQTGSPLPTATLDAALECDAVLLGAVGDNKFNALPPDKRPEAGLLQIRQALGGFANLRPSIAYAALAKSSPPPPEAIKPADTHRPRRPRQKPSPPPRSHQRRRHPLRPRAPRWPLLRRPALVEQRDRRSHQ